MIENNTVNFKEMEERAEEQRKQSEANFRAGLNAKREKAIKERQESTALFHKAIASSYEKDKEIRDAEIEVEKQKAIRAVEERFEDQYGVKSEESLNRDEDLKKMLRNINGMND